jgi:hypothetical protein
MKLLVGKSPVQVEIFRRGNPSLLTTRALLPVSGKVTDSRGNNFYVSEPDAFGLTCIFATERIELPRVSGTSDFYECSDSDGSGETSEFNYDHDWK